MPVFVTFTVSDITAAVAFHREIGFEPVATVPGPHHQREERRGPDRGDGAA